MKNPFGWMFGFLWMVVVKVHKALNPAGGFVWMPRWIQPYWMRCMGWEVNQAVIEFYKRKD